MAARRAERREDQRAYELGKQLVYQRAVEQHAHRARFGMKLHGHYMALRNALADGTYTPNHEDPTADDFLMLRTGLRMAFETDDELVAFDQFASGYLAQARSLHHSPESLARQEHELRMVRDFFAKHRTTPQSS